VTKTCLIEIIDYKNIRFHNLTPEVRRKCVNRLKFKDPKARYMTSVRLGRWDGTMSFCTVGGQTYLNFLPILMPIIQDAGYEFEVTDKRPETELKFSPIDVNFYADKTWPVGHPNQGEAITLHDHQVLAVNALLANDNALIEAATSSGKSMICAVLAKQAEKYGRTITVVPNRDLVDQTYDDFVNLGLDTGKLYFGHKDLHNQHIICTWQSLHNINKSKRELIISAEEMEALLDNVVLTIQDEVHLATSKVLFQINSELFKDIPLCYGLTGTIPKEEHLRESLRANFGEVVYAIPAKVLQDKGILSKCEVEINHLQLEKASFPDYAAERKFVSTHEDIINLVANDIIEISNAEKGNTLVLVENLDTGRLLQERIADSIFLSGKDKSKVRKKEYKEVNSEDNKVIIATYGIASTGISINRLFNLVIFNPGKSFTRSIQSIGRGLRVAHDKDFVHIKDYAINTKYSSRHLTERKSYYKSAEYPFTVIKRKV
jgi:superfamily II DNA or RNA helicase